MIDTIIHGDVLDVMKKMKSASIDLIITSPPYNISSYLKTHSNHWGDKMKDGYDLHGDDMPKDEYVTWQRKIITECLRVLKDTGALFYNHKKSIRDGIMVNHSDILNGFPVRQEIIWDRGGGLNQNLVYFTPSYESIYMIPNKNFTRLRKHPIRDVLKINPDVNNDHPAPFPVELPLQIINVTDAKVILDPFMGSGSTAVAAVRAGRHYIGIEQSPKYIQQAMTRIKNTRPDNTQRRLL